MLRRLHSYPALIAAVLVSFMAITGAFLSLEPAIAHFQAGNTSASSVTVADIASAVAKNVPGVERIVRKASGAVIAYASTDNGPVAQYVDAQTGLPTKAFAPSPVFTFMTELHRSLFLGDSGRLVAGIAALAMLVLAVSGAFLLAARMGGWRKLFTRARGTLSQRLHVEVSRMAVAGLLITAVTGAYMSLTSFGLLPDTSAAFLPFPTNVDGGTPAPIADLAALSNVPLTDLRELVYPYAGDQTDVFTLTTSAGQGYIDQATGQMLAFAANSPAQSVYETIYMLHTGQGAWWLGVLLGLAALGVPALAISGSVVWWRRRKGVPKLKGNAPHHAADTVILVGSEGNTTWGFAAVLHDALVAAGHQVHTAPMNALAHEYRRAERMFVLTATHGDGTAPQSAKGFMARLEKMKPSPKLAFSVLGFGDKSFTHFCQFAKDVETALAAKGLARLQALDTVDRQSSQAFAQWGVATGRALGVPLKLVHTPQVPRTTRLALCARQDYGVEVQEPTVVLRFINPEAPGRLARLLGKHEGPLPRFEAGDLVGIVPPGSQVPRYYSLASAAKDGFLEICVRRQPGGLCSAFLHGLEVGDTIETFVTANPDFRPARSRAPVIMIGAGTGVAPLAGFIAGNTRRRPIHLYWGGRHPQSDFLYKDTLAQCLADSRLTQLVTAFSRMVGGGYVQDKVRDDAVEIRNLMMNGAQIMVCGGRQMAAGVVEAIDEIVAPLGMNVQALKSQGRYLEDVY